MALFYFVFGDIMDKRIKLAILGLVAFLIILGIFITLSSTKAPSSTNIQHIFVTPLFVDQYLKENPDYNPPVGKSTALTNIFNINTKELSLSEEGFAYNELVVDTSAILNIDNASSSTALNFVVVSPGLDGKSYAISQFAVSPGKEVVLDMLVPLNLEDIVSKANLEKTDKGVLVFEISCVNCNEASNYLKVYAKLS